MQFKTFFQSEFIRQVFSNEFKNFLKKERLIKNKPILLKDLFESLSSEQLEELNSIIYNLPDKEKLCLVLKLSTDCFEDYISCESLLNHVYTDKKLWACGGHLDTTLLNKALVFLHDLQDDFQHTRDFQDEKEKTKISNNIIHISAIAKEKYSCNIIPLMIMKGSYFRDVFGYLRDVFCKIIS